MRERLTAIREWGALDGSDRDVVRSTLLVRRDLPVRRWLLACGFLVGSASAIAGVTSTVAGDAPSAAGVALLVAGQSLVIWLALCRATANAGAQPLTLATGITLARAGTVAVLGGFLFGAIWGVETGWLPAALFALAFALDAVDGAVARVTGRVTALGERLDLQMDALGVFVGTTLAVVQGDAPVIFVLVGLARYAFVAGIWLERRRGVAVSDLPPSRRRRPLAAGAMLVVVLALAPGPGGDFTWVLAGAFTVPFVVSFALDYLAVTGRR